MRRSASGVLRFVRSVLAATGVVLAAAGAACAGPTFNVIFHARLDQHPGYNDIWGYTAPGGDEYALLGCTTGLAVVNVSDPDAPYETGFLPGATSTWRDIKTYGHHAYVTNETSGGIAIVDLTDPENPVAAGAYTGGGFSRAHNLYIDTTTGLLHTAGSNLAAGGTRILSLADPESPVEIGSWETAYLHDVIVQNHMLWGSAINARILYVLDVTDPANIPAPLGTAQGYPAAFTHNAWPTPDGLYVMTTDETASSSCRMWDMGTLPVLQQADSYRPNATTIPHNTHIEGQFAYISYYTLGVKILDVSDPFDLAEVGAYDTWPSDDGSTFDGCWGVFPFFQTDPDLLVASDISNGLYVLEFKGPLGTVAGTVRRAGTAVPVPEASIEVVETGVAVRSDGSGTYTLEDSPGPVHLSVTAFGYDAAVVPVTITTGATTPLDFDLTLVPSGAVSGHVIDRNTALPVTGALVSFPGTPLAQSTDAFGAYEHDAIPAGPRGIRGEAFGYNPMAGDVAVPPGGSLVVDFPLKPAPAADTFQDPAPAWVVSGNATSGAWERGDPQQTVSGAQVVQPGDDHTPGAGTNCWVTGAAAGAQAGSFDVDGGETILTSPTFALASTADPHVSFRLWYTSGVVSSPTVDRFTVRVSTNAGGTWTVLHETEQSTDGWELVDVALRSILTPSNLTRFQFTARDTGVGSVTEALIDDFMIYDGPDHVPTGVAPPPLAAGAVFLSSARPNPFRGGGAVELDLTLPRDGHVRADVHDVLGRRIVTLVDDRMAAGAHRLGWDGMLDGGRRGPSGVYFVRVRADGAAFTRKILVIR